MTTIINKKQKCLEGVGVPCPSRMMADKPNAAPARRSALLSSAGLMVGHNWRLTADNENIIASRRVVARKETSPERWEPEGYFATIAGALNFLMERELKETELKDLKTVCDKIDQLRDDILKACGAHAEQKG